MYYLGTLGPKFEKEMSCLKSAPSSLYLIRQEQLTFFFFNTFTLFPNTAFVLESNYDMHMCLKLFCTCFLHFSKLF